MAFIGPLWEIGVDGGINFAELLLKRTELLTAPGEALRQARNASLGENDQDTTWAAYIAYQRLPPSPPPQEQQLWEKAKESYRSLIPKWAKLAIIITIAILVIGTIAAGAAMLSEGIALPTPTVTPSPVPPDILPPPSVTFTVTCGDGETHIVQAGETITLSVFSVIFIEPSIPPLGWDGTRPERLSETKLLSYAVTDFGSDIVIFTFEVNEETAEARMTKSLSIAVVPEGHGLCSR